MAAGTSQCCADAVLAQDRAGAVGAAAGWPAGWPAGRSVRLVIHYWSIVELCIRARRYRGSPSWWCRPMLAVPGHAVRPAVPGGRSIVSPGNGAETAILRRIYRSRSHYRSHRVSPRGWSSRDRNHACPILSRSMDNGRGRLGPLMFCASRKNGISVQPGTSPAQGFERRSTRAWGSEITDDE